jgi:hypothetical protein
VSRLEQSLEAHGRSKELFGQILTEQSIRLSEDIQARLFASIFESPKPAEDKRQLRVYITDKATGAILIDWRMHVLDAPGILQGFAEIFKTQSQQNSFILADDYWHIELSIDDEPEARAAGAEGSV